MTEIEFVRRWRKLYVVLEGLEHELSAGFVTRMRDSLDEVGAQARGAYAAGDRTTITLVVGVLEEIEREMLGVEASFRAEHRPRRPVQQGQDE
jgi:hypothetical protein